MAYRPYCPGSNREAHWDLVVRAADAGGSVVPKDSADAVSYWSECPYCGRTLKERRVKTSVFRHAPAVLPPHKPPP